MARSAPTRRQAARLDQAFQRLLSAFRSAMLERLAAEPPGPARHLRVYVLSLCDQLLLRPPGRAAAARLLARPAHRQTWREFVAEACAQDDVDETLSRRCRAEVERLWCCQFLGEGVAPGEVLSVRDCLLAKCDAAASGTVHPASDRCPPRHRLHPAALPVLTRGAE